MLPLQLVSDWIRGHKSIDGIINCSSPNPVSNSEFMKTLRKLTNKPLGLPATKWMLQSGAWLIGTEAELVLKSRWVTPTRITETGFQFKYPHIKEALRVIISKVPPQQYRFF